jgi:hypothetical protein
MSDSEEDARAEEDGGQEAYDPEEEARYYGEQETREQAYYDGLEQLFQEGLKSQAKEAVKSYLGRYGDAVDQRVLACITEAKVLLQHGHFGPSLCAAAIAVELMIRFMLFRPLIQGAFLSDEWAGILTDRIVTGQTAKDRELVPAVLRQWGLDVTQVRGSTSKRPVWEYTVSQLFPSRHNYVHRYDPVPESTAVISVECAEAFRYEIVGALAKQIGFSLDLTGKWCEIDHPREEHERTIINQWSEEFEPADPFT